MNLIQQINESITNLPPRNVFNAQLERLAEKIHDIPNIEKSTAVYFVPEAYSMCIKFFSSTFGLGEDMFRMLNTSDHSMFHTIESIQKTFEIIYNHIEKHGPKCFTPLYTLTIKPYYDEVVYRKEKDIVKANFLLSVCEEDVEEYHKDVNVWKWVETIYTETGDDFAEILQTSRRKTIADFANIADNLPNTYLMGWSDSFDQENEYGNIDRTTDFKLSIFEK